MQVFLQREVAWVNHSLISQGETRILMLYDKMPPILNNYVQVVYKLTCLFISCII
jgi:hypothetical protein